MFDFGFQCVLGGGCEQDLWTRSARLGLGLVQSSMAKALDGKHLDLAQAELEN